MIDDLDNVPDIVDGKRAYLIRDGELFARFGNEWVPVDDAMRAAMRPPGLTPSPVERHGVGFAPDVVAKAVLVNSIARLDYNQECDFCRAGEGTDAEDNRHEDGCPFYGYDHTDDIQKLLDWCKS